MQIEDTTPTRTGSGRFSKVCCTIMEKTILAPCFSYKII